MKTKFLAHTAPDGREQTLKEHSENVAMLCGEFAGSQLQELAYLAGLLHDVGKYQESFGRRLRGEKIRVEHSTCGAKAAYEKYGTAPEGLLLAYIIMGHHSGLPDAGVQSDTSDMTTLYARLKRSFESYEAYQEELQLPELDLTGFRNLLMQDCDMDSEKLVDKFAFLTRFCASCLVDADSLDTAKFCNGEPPRKLQTDFEACLKDVNQRLDRFVCKTELQKTRGFLQRQALSKTGINADVYLMNMPTGSGKTLCSIKFALERLLKSRVDGSFARPKKRIIYIIPFNSIIDQTYRAFHKIFREHAEILRHQSTFSYSEEDRKETEQKLVVDDSEDYKRLARNAIENWDADSIIITTAVQFFESLYSNQRSKLRSKRLTFGCLEKSKKAGCAFPL